MEQGRSEWRRIVFAGIPRFELRSRRFVIGVVIAALVVYLLSGVYVVQSDEQGVVVRFGRIVNDKVPPGIHYHLPAPVERVFRPKTAEIKKVYLISRQPRAGGAEGMQMLTGDENVVLVQVVIQYRISDAAKYLFACESPRRLIEVTSDKVVTEVVGSMSVDALLTTEKLVAQARIKESIQDILNQYGVGVTIIGAYFQDISPPIEVAYAFRDVASAREDRNRVINEAEGYRNTIIPAARGEAERMIKEAEAYRKERVERARGEADAFLALLSEYEKNKELTASRLYVEKMEKILPRMRIYVLDKKGGKGVINLRLLQPGRSSTSSQLLQQAP